MLLLLIFSLATCRFVHSQNANDFCFSCQGARNHKDLYANPDDCHTYYQCSYTGEEGVALGYLRKCANGTFWNDYILQCVPEGSTPCTDPCRDKTVDQHGCHGVPTNCRQYWVCGHQTSFPFCCPQGTSFVLDSCACEASETCEDSCSRDQALPPLLGDVQLLPDGSCIDVAGVTLRPVEGNAAKFLIVNPEDPTITTESDCAIGSEFDVSDCSCSKIVENRNVPLNKQCTLYLPFDEDVNDHSIHKFWGEAHDGATIQNNVAARGAGSLQNSGSGRVEISAFKNLRYDIHSACLFFRCENPPCVYNTAGLFSQRDCAACGDSVHATSLQDNSWIRVETMCNYSSPLLFNVPLMPVADDTPAGFRQLCITSNGTTGVIYLDNRLLGYAPVVCETPLTPCPFFVGFDRIYGAFQGYIDEFLFCHHDIGAEGVNAHYQGQDALRSAGLIP